MGKMPQTIRSETPIAGAAPAIIAPQEVAANARADQAYGKTLEVGGAKVKRETEILGARIDVFETNIAKTKFYDEATRIGAEVEEMEDHTQWQSEYDKRLKQAAKRLGAQEISGGDASVFHTAASNFTTRGAERMRVKARTRNNQVKNAALLNAVDTNLKNALRSDSTADAEGFITTTHQLIDQAVAKYGLSPLVANNMKQKFIDDLSAGKLLTLEPFALVEAVDKIRSVDKKGNITWDDKPTGTFLDLIPREKLEKAYQQAEAKSAGQKIAGRSQAASASIFEEATKKGWSLQRAEEEARKQGYYKKFNVPNSQIPSTIDHTITRLRDSFKPLLRDRIRSATDILMGQRKADGTMQTQEVIMRAATRLDNELRGGVEKLLVEEFGRLNKFESDGLTEVALADMKKGKTEAELIGTTENLRPGVKSTVQRNIRDAFKLQRLAGDRAIEDKYDAAIKRVDEDKPVGEKDMDGLSAQQRSHIMALRDHKNKLKADPNYQRPNTRDGTASFREAMKDETKFLNLSLKQLRQKFELKVSKNYWESIVLAAWGKEGKTGGKGNAGLTEVKRVAGAFKEAGGGSDEDEERFSASYHRRIVQFGAKTIAEEDKILAQLKNEKFLIDKNWPQSVGGIWEMDEGDKIEMAGEMEIPEKDRKDFADNLGAIIRSIAAEKKDVNRKSILEKWNNKKATK